jgi:DNA-binding beta-propeller fold protein YncE
MLSPLKMIVAAFTGTLALLAQQGLAATQPAETTALALEAKIPIGNVSGRIDHMAIDLARQRLFVAELGNNSLGIVDLNGRRVLRTIEGLNEPQGVAYVPSVDTVYVANAGDGSVRLFQGPNYTPAGQIALGEDADNIRLDVATKRIFVGHGSGGLALIDAATSRKVADIPLSAHPEGFQLDPSGNRIFVNLPKAQAIAVVDREAGKQTASWPMRVGRDNFPMAFDQAARRVLVAFRSPAKLGVFAADDGALIASPEICGDADDVFVDAKRHRVYVSCGDGFLDVLDAERSAYRRIARIPTVAGARTSLFVRELDRLLLAVRASGAEPAAVWVFRPFP